MFSQRNLECDDIKKIEKKNYLDNSYHYKQLKIIHNRMKTQEDKEYTSDWINALEAASNLNDVLHRTRDLDPEHTDSLFIYQLGRHKWNALLFVGGYASDRINFNYHLLHLRESIQTHLNSMRKGYF